MRNFGRIILCLLAVSLTPPINRAWSDEPAIFHAPLSDTREFEKILTGLRGSLTLRASFEQDRFINGLSKPLRSSGKFIFSTESGAAWIQSAPFKVAYVITPKGARRVSMTENLDSESIENNPIIEKVSATLLSVWSGSLTELQSNFDIYFTGSTRSWTVGLKPKSDNVSLVLSSIVLIGDSVVRNISILDTSGDRTAISLSQIEDSPELTPDEVKLFS